MPIDKADLFDYYHRFFPKILETLDAALPSLYGQSHDYALTLVMMAKEEMADKKALEKERDEDA